MNNPCFKKLFFISSLFMAWAIAHAETMQLTSPAFAPNQMIPIKFTCKGGNISPALEWKNIPSGTESLALIVDDPDATNGTYTHWVIYNIPKNSTGLKEGTKLSDGEVLGLNSSKQNNYAGPCPPSGTHHYNFTLYALSKEFKGGKDEKIYNNVNFNNEMEDYIIAKTTLIGMYTNLK